ncbi:MAG: TetR/AcrR family transcriptional regulator [Phenylobacterium sp.]
MSGTEKTRKIPTQRRSRATVEVVLEAAAQLLESAGERGFNTNAVAERAGVSIGTLYRYFPDKQSILTALARREMEAVNTATAALLARKKGDLAFDRAMIRTFVQAFEGRTRARRVAVAALLANADPAELAAAHPAANASIVDAEGRPLSRVAAFVLSRAMHGAMRAAVMEDADFLTSKEFEDELVRLGRSYLGYVAPRA